MESPAPGLDRKLSAPKGEIEKAASAKRASFAKAAHEKPAMQFDAQIMLQALCKPWELGGHPHDFLVSHRSARTTDPYQHYEQDKFLLQRHERLVAEKESWNRQRKLREDMLHLLTRLHSVERQRRRFIEKRRQSHPDDFEHIPNDFKEEHANIELGPISLAGRFFQKRPSQFALLMPKGAAAVRPAEMRPGDPPTEPAKIGYEEKVITVVPSARTVLARQEVQELDSFEERLQSLLPNAAGNAESFKKKK